MSSIIDRSILLIFGAIMILMNADPLVGVYYIAFMVGLGSLCEVFKNTKWIYLITAIFVLMCFFIEYLVLFVAMMMYDYINKKQFAIPILMSVIHLYLVLQLKYYIVILLSISIVCAITQKIRTDIYNNQQNFYIRKGNDLTENNIQLENKIDVLLAKQDIEIQIATLDERNRIAREIHDTVGHLLSSSILQLGAVMVGIDDIEVNNDLSTLKETLSEGMNSVRSSVHNLRDTSIDLESQINRIIGSFHFCDIKLRYMVKSRLSTKQKYAVIAIIKEALSNVIKHSNATNVEVSLFEHNQLYQVVIRDNGTILPDSELITNDESVGMGLENIKHRVKSLEGYFGLDVSDGFKVFISFPKGEVYEDNFN